MATGEEMAKEHIEGWHAILHWTRRAWSIVVGGVGGIVTERVVGGGGVDGR